MTLPPPPPSLVRALNFLGGVLHQVDKKRQITGRNFNAIEIFGMKLGYYTNASIHFLKENLKSPFS